MTVSPLLQWDDPSLDRVLEDALREDIGTGDVTTNSLFPRDESCQGAILSKQHGVLAGLPAAYKVFQKLDADVLWKEKRVDGSKLAPGDVLAELRGSRRAILTGERVALNMLQRLSGIATTTSLYVKAVEGLPVTILDTRKTTPGLRALEKYAVRMGGGTNHRLGLDDAVLIKNNHIKLVGSIPEAVERIRRIVSAVTPIEVETATLEELRDALHSGADRIMLDNMSLEMMREAVRIVAGQVPLEASGNVSLERVRAIAETGVNFISVGALTHSFRALDIALHID